MFYNQIESINLKEIYNRMSESTKSTIYLNISKVENLKKKFDYFLFMPTIWYTI